MASPLRLRILRLCLDAPLTNKQIAAALGRDPASVLYHVRRLVRTGFLAPEQERRGSRGAREVPYRATGKSWTLDVVDAGAGPRHHRRWSRRSSRTCAGSARRTWRRARLGLRLTPAEHEELTQRLSELYEDFARPEVRRRAVVAVRGPAPGRPAGRETRCRRPLRVTPSEDDDQPTRPPPRPTLDRVDSDGSYDLEERRALRRVPGLATELADVTEVEYRQLRLERVVLVGVWTSGTVTDAEHSLAELARLAETAGSQVLEGLMQRRDRPDPATYIGSGKAKEVRDVVVATGADTVICDGELTPGQLRQLEEVVKVKVIDRTALILDIFAQHARSREGKAQVELAQLQYLLPQAARLGRVDVPAGRRPGRRRRRHRHPRAR